MRTLLVSLSRARTQAARTLQKAARLEEEARKIEQQIERSMSTPKLKSSRSGMSMTSSVSRLPPVRL